MLDLEPVNRAFTRQAARYDQDDLANPILQDLRRQVYAHVGRFLKPGSSILELNAGTGLDAKYFVQQGHTVHATDLSDGMIEQHKKKIAQLNVNGRWTVEKLSFTELEKLRGKSYDFVFSNFGGLNCVPDVGRVTSSLHSLVTPHGYVTLVVMPPICPWELLGLFKGNAGALRRLRANGTEAQIEGQYFRTWYHSLGSVRRAMGKGFTLIKSEGLAAVSPPPHLKEFPTRHPGMYRAMRSVDAVVRGHFPFNRMADHLIITFRRNQPA